MQWLNTVGERVRNHLKRRSLIETNRLQKIDFISPVEKNRGGAGYLKSLSKYAASAAHTVVLYSHYNTTIDLAQCHNLHVGCDKK